MSQIIYKKRNLSNLFFHFPLFSFAYREKRSIITGDLIKNFFMKSVDFFLDFFERIPFKKTISIFLIFAILVSQTIRWDFFLDASADIKDYRDIVSLIVDQETYKELRPEISRYAEDIQKYL